MKKIGFVTNAPFYLVLICSLKFPACLKLPDAQVQDFKVTLNSIG